MFLFYLLGFFALWANDSNKTRKTIDRMNNDPTCFIKSNGYENGYYSVEEKYGKR